jgi:MFS family permease
MPDSPQDASKSSTSKRDAYAAFRFPAYRGYALANLVSNLGRQMLAVAIGYEIFQRTHSATALGLVGLVGAIPIIFLSIPAGIVTDRFNRKSLFLITQFISTLTSVGLVASSLYYTAIPAAAPLVRATQVIAVIAGWFHEKRSVEFQPALPLIFLLLFVNGISRAFGWAARSAFLPNLIPRTALSTAVMWNSSTFEFTCVVGPALGGLAIARLGTASVYAFDAFCALACMAFVFPIRAPQEIAKSHPHALRDLFTGLGFVFENKIILATITLDLFAVLLGGALALLPIFADRILHVDAVGLGWLRAAPSVGAVTMAFILTHRPPLRQAGNAMLLAVAGFGVTTIIFGLSRNFALSFFALLATGACDNVSVVVRHTLVQLLTPDAMRGRVSAVNNIFIGSSNDLGAFESGITAALWGPIVSVVLGGIGTIIVVVATAWKWPQIRAFGPLQPKEEIPEPVD